MKLLRQKRLERDKKRRERTERIKRKGKKIKVYMDTGYDDWNKLDLNLFFKINLNYLNFL